MGGSKVQRSYGVAADLIDLLHEYAATGTPYVLATVVRTEAPTSAHPGDKAVVTADGRLHGWIGGSCSEPIVRREALRALAEGVPQLVRIVPAPEVKQTRKRGELMVATTCPSGGALDIFIEPQLPRPLLLVFGDSPAARTLVHMGSLAGFRTCSVHPGALPGDFGTADIVLGSLELAGANPGADTWAVVATMGHYDEDALEAALAYPDVDVGLIASTRRAAAVRDALQSRGMDEKTLGRIRAPAGKVRAGSQEEIALLALAEVVTARRKRGHVPAPVEASAVVFATDQVCGMTVDPLTAQHKVVHGDATYWFCSAGCQAEFEKEPARYLRTIEA
ncbi:MAG TPA: XdhC family protein [Candidatus Dormibacteraeota bacterium]